LSNSETRRKEEFAFLKSGVAILLILGCLWASQWQFHRGIARQDRNATIESKIDLPAVELSEAVQNPNSYEWRQVLVTGKFDSTKQILLRNRYFEGKYGFEALTAFRASTGETFWVDRGWVQAGATATEQPELPATPTGEVRITGRMRLDRSLPQGKFFAIPTGKKGGLISEANAQASNTSKGIDSPFYLDLLSGDDPLLTPKVEAALPELSDGPHMAYALQWLFFGGLVVYGRFLIRREVLTREEL
jgi:cytochrome oxidase assembly protein ShyY1